MTPAARDATVQRFTNDPEVTVFLISLKAGKTFSFLPSKSE